MKCYYFPMDQTLHKNEVYIVVIEAYSSDASGICHIGGMTVFVPYALIGEKVKIRILKVLSSFAYGKIMEILVPSDHRTDPVCPYYHKCGGCTSRHMDSDEELQMKLDSVNSAFSRIGHQKISVSEIHKSPDIDRYRNKVSYSFTNKDGRIVCGFYRERTHNVIAADDCLIQPVLFSKIAAAVTDLFNRFGFKAYMENDGSGSIRHLFIRSAHSSGEVIICITSAKGLGKHTSIIVKEIISVFPEITGIILNIDKDPGNKLLKGDFYTLWGKDSIRDTLCDITFDVSPLSFYQVNSPQAERLYYKVLEYAVHSETDSILDLYCGIGTISLYLARHVNRVIGVEIVDQAIENAKSNAELNEILNAEFYCSDASSFKDYIKDFSPSCVVVDPPRKGLGRETINNVCDFSPERIVYVSCNPATLARDLVTFNELGYFVIDSAAYDMFPKTYHIETVVLLSRRKDEPRIQIAMTCKSD